MKIKDWEEFQHYKSGRGAPPWIKLYRRLLDDKEWHSLPGESAKILVSCWILAAEYGGKLPDIETIAFRLRIDSKTLEKHLKNCSHWIILNEINDASKVLADSKQLATPETETETETDIPKKRKPKKTTIHDDFSISESVATWAEKNGYSNLEKRHAHFVNVCKAKGYEYADWDAAFRNAISNDWAKLGGQKKTEAFNMDSFLRKVNGQ